MPQSTPGPVTRLGKRKFVSPEVPSSRDPKRLKLSLRAVAAALTKWRMNAEDLDFSSHKGNQKKGGCADIAKATASSPTFISPNFREFRSPQTVAVKMFRFGRDADNRTQVACFANELNLLSELKHKNIVEWVGFVENAEKGVAWILLDWADNGNLREFIHSRDWVIPERLSLIHDVACGVAYLHSRDPPICHGDLKSLNILVTPRNEAVITDFGSARKLDSYLPRAEGNTAATPGLRADLTRSPAQEEVPLIQIGECGTFITLTGPAYTLRWAAPELLNEEPFSLASDMWAFGWICWEIMTGKLPFDDVYKESHVVRRVTEGELPPVSSNEHIFQLRTLCATMKRCWSMDPAKRPTAVECERSIFWMDRIPPVRRHCERESAEVLCALGYTSYESLKNEEAAAYFERALKAAQSARDQLGTANALMGQGTVHRVLRDYSQAEASYNKAKDIYTLHGAERQITDAIWGLGQVYRMRKEYAKAERSYIRVREICMRLGAQMDVADAIWGLGEVYRLQGSYPQAEASYTEAKEIYARLGAEKDVASSCWGLGEAYRLWGEYSKAEASYIEAKEIYALLGAEKSVAGAGLKLGDVYRLQGNYLRAETIYIEAKEIYTRIGAEGSVAYACRGLGEVYRLRGEYSKAEELFAEAKGIYTRSGTERDVAGAGLRLGQVYRLQGKHSEAEALYVEARDIYSRFGAEDSVASASLALGEVCRLQDKYSAAEAFYTEAKEIYGNLRAEKDVGDAIRGLEDVYRARKECAKANLLDISPAPTALKDVADSGLRLGEIYRLSGEYSKAEALYLEAKEIYARLEAAENVADAGLRLGELYRFRGRYSEAEALYVEAADIYSRFQAEERVATANLVLGEVCRLQGKYPKAEAPYKKAKEIYARLGAKQHAADATRGLKKVRRARKKYAQADASCTTAREIHPGHEA